MNQTKLNIKTLIERVVDKKLKEMKYAPEKIQELDRGTHVSEALRDVLDDLLMATEMLIDEKYGKVGLEEFKKLWYKSTQRIEKQFLSVLKNMSR